MSRVKGRRRKRRTHSRTPSVAPRIHERSRDLGIVDHQLQSVGAEAHCVLCCCCVPCASAGREAGEFLVIIMNERKAEQRNTGHSFVRRCPCRLQRIPPRQQTVGVLQMEGLKPPGRAIRTKVPLTDLGFSVPIGGWTSQ